MITELESLFSARLNADRVIAVGSAMDGLQLALQACQVGPGVEVVVDPIVTFGGLAVMYCNGVPIFADINPNTYNMSSESLRSRITKRTKAIICTHFAGLPCEMDEIISIARENNLIVIEDAAHALFSQYKGQYAGLLGDVGVFSFNHRKQLSTGQGGMVTFRNQTLYEEVKSILTFGRVPKRLAWNTNMPGIVAAVAISQLDKAEDYVREDHWGADLMNEAIAACPWLVKQYVPDYCWSSQHLWAATYRGDQYGVNSDEFKRVCKEEGADYFLFGFMPPNWENVVGSPVYAYPVFSEPRAYGTSYGEGCPIRCPWYDGNVNYKPGYCSVAEDISPRMMNTTLSPITRNRISGLAEGLHRAISRIG
jgi:dTDP-4-amino-4,6-dideoxygalactose transaminase